ncbi:hypothetical protein BaRGS_00018683 [Batillaria attramentaria]|uniref:Uncharacterized protein n=1 Tax=Batillaria attramentaria TaxID=370345 RepID=A0ABD0KRT1_9CAEN
MSSGQEIRPLVDGGDGMDGDFKGGWGGGAGIFETQPSEAKVNWSAFATSLDSTSVACELQTGTLAQQPPRASVAQLYKDGCDSHGARNLRSLGWQCAASTTDHSRAPNRSMSAQDARVSPKAASRQNDRPTVKWVPLKRSSPSRDVYHLY